MNLIGSSGKDFNIGGTYFHAIASATEGLEEWKASDDGRKKLVVRVEIITVSSTFILLQINGQAPTRLMPTLPISRGSEAGETR